MQSVSTDDGVLCVENEVCQTEEGVWRACLWPCVCAPVGCSGNEAGLMLLLLLLQSTKGV